MRRSGQMTFLFFLSLFGYLGMFSIIYFYLRVLTKFVQNWYMFHLSLNVKYLLQSTTVNKRDGSGKWDFKLFFSLWISWHVFIIYFYLRVLTMDVLNWCMFHLSLNVKYLSQSTTVNKWHSPGKWHSEFFLFFWISWHVFNNLFLSQSANNGCSKLMYVPSIM